MKKTLMLTDAVLAKLAVGKEVSYGDIKDISMIGSRNYRNIDRKFVDELKQSITEEGIKNPVMLICVKIDDKTELFCLDGHHRIEAVKELREAMLKENKAWLYRALPCSVKVVDFYPEGFGDAAILNGVRRKDTVIERARAIADFKKQGLSNSRIAQKMGMDRRAVDRAAVIADLPEAIISKIEPILDKTTDGAIYNVAKKVQAVQAGESLDEIFPDGKGSLEDRAIEALSSRAGKKEPKRESVAGNSAMLDRYELIETMKAKLAAAKFTQKQIETVIASIP